MRAKISSAILPVMTLILLTGCPQNSSTDDSGPSCTSATGTLPTGSTAASLTRVAMTGCTLIDYSFPITIGGQAGVNVIADSGSTILAVAGSNCSNCTSILPVYPESHGTELFCSTISSQYGDNTGWQGPTFQDTVAVGTLPTGALPAVTDDFVAIESQTTSPAFFTDYDCNLGNNGTNSSQGIMGLAYSGLTTTPAVGYFDAVESQLSLPSDAFSVELCMEGGNIWFGGYDSTYTTGTAPQYTPITAPSGQGGEFYWATVNDIKFNGISLGFQPSDYTTPIVDTGTSLAILPPAVFNSLQAAIAGISNFSNEVTAEHQGTASNWFSNGAYCLEPGWTPATLDSKIPGITIIMPQVGGGTITLNLPASKSIFDVHQDTHGNYYYCPGISPNPQSIDFMIIGGSFLRSLITIFDRGNSQIGFAVDSQCNP